MGKYLGLDLSLCATGYCVIDFAVDGKIKVDAKGIIETENSGEMPNNRFPRWEKIWKDIQSFTFKRYTIEGVAIENYSFGSKGAKKTQMIESGAIVRSNIIDIYHNHIIEIAPIQLKKFILGHIDAKGKEAKNIMCREVYKKYNLNINNDNEVDAFLLAIIAALYDNFDDGIIQSEYPKYQMEIIKMKLDNEALETARIGIKGGLASYE